MLTLLKQYTTDEGEVLIRRKARKNDTMKLFLRYKEHGLDFRCWCCGRIVNSIIGCKGYINGNKKPWNGQIPFIMLACIDTTGLHIFNVDHIVPVCYGGPNTYMNYRPSCMKCNESRRELMSGDEIHYMKYLIGHSKPPHKSIKQIKSHPINIERVTLKHNDWDLRIKKILEKEVEHG